MNKYTESLKTTQYTKTRLQQIQKEISRQTGQKINFGDSMYFAIQAYDRLKSLEGVFDQIDELSDTLKKAYTSLNKIKKTFS